MLCYVWHIARRRIRIRDLCDDPERHRPDHGLLAQEPVAGSDLFHSRAKGELGDGLSPNSRRGAASEVETPHQAGREEEGEGVEPERQEFRVLPEVMDPAADADGHARQTGVDRGAERQGPIGGDEADGVRIGQLAARNHVRDAGVLGRRPHQRERLDEERHQEDVAEARQERHRRVQQAPGQVG